MGLWKNEMKFSLPGMEEGMPQQSITSVVCGWDEGRVNEAKRLSHDRDSAPGSCVNEFQTYRGRSKTGGKRDLDRKESLM